MIDRETYQRSHTGQLVFGVWTSSSTCPRSSPSGPATLATGTPGGVGHAVTRAATSRRRQVVTEIAGIGSRRNVCRAEGAREPSPRTPLRGQDATPTVEQALPWAADGAAHLRGMMTRMGDDAFAKPSSLPDWTRAHLPPTSLATRTR